MRRRLQRFCAALLLIALPLAAGCSTTVTAPPPAPPIESYIVGAPDNLRIHVLPEPELLRDVRVRPDGKISIDLVGDVQASGKTPFEIAQDIQREIRRFKRDAMVNVSVVSSPSRFVTVYGEVTTPGIFQLDTETRVSEAIGRVGGTRPFAKLGGVRIVRSNGLDTEILTVRLNDIAEGDLSTNFVVQEGDLIVVPPTWLARVGYAVQMVLFPLQPIISGATTAGAIAGGVNSF